MENLGKILRAPRSGQSTSFADGVSPDQSMQEDYVRGLIVVTCIIGSFAVLWFLILLILKFKGDKVGCASGQPFRRRPEEEIISFTESSSLGEDSGYSENGSPDPIRDATDPEDFHASEASASFDNDSNYHGDGDNWSKEEEDEALNSEPTEREFRTRLVFLFFCCVVLICIPCILVFSFGPMKEALQTSDNTMMVSFNIIRCAHDLSN